MALNILLNTLKNTLGGHDAPICPPQSFETFEGHYGPICPRPKYLQKNFEGQDRFKYPFEYFEKRFCRPRWVYLPNSNTLKNTFKGYDGLIRPPTGALSCELPCRGPCRAMPCCAVPCRAVPRRAAPCRAVPCRAVPCRAVLCREDSDHHL